MVILTNMKKYGSMTFTNSQNKELCQTQISKSLQLSVSKLTQHSQQSKVSHGQ